MHSHPNFEFLKQNKFEGSANVKSISVHLGAWIGFC